MIRRIEVEHLTVDPVELVTEARREAAGAIAVCDICLARACCLELSLRNWDIGQHGVWGGLVPAERETLRRKRRVRHAETAPSRRT